MRAKITSKPLPDINTPEDTNKFVGQNIMKNEYHGRVPLVSAIIAGVVAWIIHPSLFEFVAAPIRQSFVDQMPSEIFFYRLKTVAAFTALGALVPIAAACISRTKPDRIYCRSLGALIFLAILLALSTTWMMYANLATLSGFFSELQAKDSSIPAVAGHSIIPLHRIALYPALLMVMIIIAVMFVSTFKSRATYKQEDQQAP